MAAVPRVRPSPEGAEPGCTLGCVFCVPGTLKVGRAEAQREKKEHLRKCGGVCSHRFYISNRGRAWCGDMRPGGLATGQSIRDGPDCSTEGAPGQGWNSSPAWGLLQDSVLFRRPRVTVSFSDAYHYLTVLGTRVTDGQGAVWRKDPLVPSRRLSPKAHEAGAV